MLGLEDFKLNSRFLVRVDCVLCHVQSIQTKQIILLDLLEVHDWVVSLKSCLYLDW